MTEIKMDIKDIDKNFWENVEREKSIFKNLKRNQQTKEIKLWQLGLSQT